jgi:LAGLIDADG DNA endonuclease family
MGDGTYDKGRNQRIILCTDCFNLSKINYLRTILLDKYKINTRVKSGKRASNTYYRISISGENRKKFQDLVSPFIIPSLLYRIGL